MTINRPLPRVPATSSALARKCVFGYPSAVRRFSDNIDLLAETFAELHPHLISRRFQQRDDEVKPCGGTA